MNPVATQQVALDNTLVAPKKRLKIEKCNERIEFSKPQREETYQVTLDDLKLSPSYLAFLITAEVARILRICPRLPNQDFVEPPSEEEMVPFIQELSYSGKCDMLSAIHTDQMHQPWRTFVAIINRCISGKSTGLDRLRPSRAQILINLHTVHDDSLLGTLKSVSRTQDYQMYGALIPKEMINQDIKNSKAYKTYLDFATRKATPKKAKKFKKVSSPSKKLSPVLEEEEKPAKKPKQAKKPAKKSTTVQIAGVVIKDTPGVSMSKKKAPAKGNSEADDSNDDDGDDDDDVDSDADGDNEAKEYVRTPDNYEFSDNDEEYEELYKDVNVRLKDAEHEEERKGDAEMTDVGRDDVSQEKSYEQVEDDAHVTLTAAHVTQKIEGPMQSSSVSSDFANQFLNLDNVPLVDNEVISMMNVKSTPTPTPAPTTKATITSIPALLDFSSLFRFDQRVSVLEKELSQLKQVDYSAQLLETIKSYTTEFEKKAQAKRKRYIDLVEKSVKDIIKDKVKSQLPQILPKEVSEFATPMIQSTITESLKNVILLDKMQKSKSYPSAQEHKELYDRLVKSYKLDKDLFESYGKVYSLKRDHEDKDKDEDPLAGSEQGLKGRKTTKDVEPSKGFNQKNQIQAHPKNQGSDLGNTDDQPNVEAALKHDWFKKPERPSTPDSDWNARKTINFRPPQTLISKIAKAEKPPLTFDELMSTPIDFSAYVMNNLKIDNLTQEHLVGLAFNLLKRTCRSRVELEYHFEEYRGRQVVHVNYFINNDLEYLKGGSSSKLYTTSTTKTKAANNMVSKHDVFSTKRIIIVTHVKVMKWYDYGYLEEIVVRREDQKLYKFNEGDFPRLNLRDIEDMLLLLVQKKIANLERDVIFDLNVALRMFTRCVVILKRVEDLQLGVESYQKKLNITKPDTFRPDISKRTSYTAYRNHQGIIYIDKFKINMLMRSDELYKFSDGTLTSVRYVLHDIVSNLGMDYLPKRR
ncbi:hypothetical protein Tco_0100036 [Tanacetum coccineum]